ncbi:MAG: hypothetical protein ABIN97_04645, partial [Ginsengibacter sp.]
ISDYQKTILADPQTSGGLLIAVEEDSVEEVKKILLEEGIECLKSVGGFIKSGEKVIQIN